MFDFENRGWSRAIRLLEWPRMMRSQKQAEQRRTELLLGSLALLGLLVGCVFVLWHFLTSLMWAVVLSYALYPLQKRFTRWLRGRRTLAACLVSLSLTLILAGPIILIGFSLAEDARSFGAECRRLMMQAPETPPSWISGLPLVGEEVDAYWGSLIDGRRSWLEEIERDEAAPQSSETETDAAADPPKLVGLLGRSIEGARDWLIAAGLAVGNGVLQVLLSAFLTFFFLRDADRLALRLRVVVDRLAGGRGRHLIEVAGDTVNSVVYGILGTALIQGLLAGIGFAIAGVPGAVLLGVLTFFVAVIPFGPPLVWVPASLWLFAIGQPGWGVFMLIWGGLGISSVDNVVRPLLISQGSKMPFALIFCGVVGGALAFGLVGVFLGPTLLAVAYRLIDEWSVMPYLAEEKT
jgi:predicted PurR-regulated permease PerM